jgi:hypothetical protein
VAATLKRIVLTLTCIDAPEVMVSFEPEGATHVLARGDQFRVEMVGPDDGDPEISHSPGWLTVVRWTTADLRVWNKAGEECPRSSGRRDIAQSASLAPARCRLARIATALNTASRRAA